ncbi:hypothetical protein PY310_21505 [Pseudarthrobacter sp. H3Y2-7]|uniref:hypothetical protein n=1 Tax=Pseudarthrobacter naphthalenicus TaxID=3031328 RepID=UPI0023B00A24|nr:hypothetical protein [Pseudarthrobacter sp. H3Y2-7]MDE8671123.1 hypothetical protein [Pseudarthrobacter sp. H3Y2-7]
MDSMMSEPGTGSMRRSVRMGRPPAVTSAPSSIEIRDCEKTLDSSGTVSCSAAAVIVAAVPVIDCAPIFTVPETVSYPSARTPSEKTM